MKEQEIGGCQQTRVSGSALIAEFMGISTLRTADPNIILWSVDDKFPNRQITVGNPEMGITTSLLKYRDEQLMFHTSWDWLMPVVEKIYKTKIGDGTDTIDYTYLRTFGMINEENGNAMVRFNCFGLHQSERLIDATFNAVVEVLQSIPKADR